VLAVGAALQSDGPSLCCQRCL